jgi:4-hydroxybenzoate polyprenyltransferase
MGTSLRSFHLVVIACSIVLAAGTGVWALLNRQALLAVLSLIVAVLLILYRIYFEEEAERAHLRE